MKIILSRKGFDDAHGGIASPVFPGGEMLSFPIPGTDDKKKKDKEQSDKKKTDKKQSDNENKPRKDNIEYSTLRFILKNPDGTVCEEISLNDILKNLGYNEQKYSKFCHLDPDLVEDRRKSKVKDWKAAFGQINQSAKYLQNQHVGAGEDGDLFLFFGNFHHVEKKDGKYFYVRKSDKDDYRGSTFQAIWGYMQVEKVLTDPKEIMKYEWHPHACSLRNDGSDRAKNNTLYLPRETLSFRPELPGYGVFDYDEKRILTKKGCTKGVWKYNEAYDLSVVETRKNSAKDKKNSIYYAGIWQELVLDDKKSVDWAKGLF
jgi:hypothetical protein